MDQLTIKSQIQKPIFSASIERSIAILLLPHNELVTNIEQELQNNPLLEADFENIQSEKTLEASESPIELEKMNALLNLSYSNTPKSNAEDDEFESFSVASNLTLEDHLFQQLYFLN